MLTTLFKFLLMFLFERLKNPNNKTPNIKKKKEAEELPVRNGLDLPLNSGTSLHTSQLQAEMWQRPTWYS